MAISAAILVLGALIVGGAWLWAQTGDGTGGANIGAGVLALLGLAVAVGGLIALAATGIAYAVAGTARGRHAASRPT